MIIRDSLTVKANFKNAKFDWTRGRTAMSQVSYLFHFGFLGWVHTTFLQEISADYGALTTFFRRFFRSLRNASITAIKSVSWT